MFRRLLGLEKKSNLASPSPDFALIFGVRATSAGIAVTAANALESPTTLAACRVISEAIGSLPFHLFRRNSNGSRQRETSTEAAALLAGDWCPWAGGAETRTALQLDALLHGAGYGLVIRVNGEVREIHRLDPTAVTRDTTGPEPRFKVRDNGAERIFDWRDILYLPTPGSAANRLLCLISLCREAIALDIVMAKYQGGLFANGARPAGVFKLKDKLGEGAQKRLSESFKSSFSGGENAGKTMILEGGMDFEPLEFSSVDMQFIELRRFAIQEIARAFKVPGTLVGDLDRATWRNVEELSRQFVQTCLMPWTEVWQAALERVLLKQDERKQFFVEAIFDDMLRGDLSARFTAYRQACGGAWLTRDEIRQLDNREPIEGGDTLILQAGQGDNTPTDPPQEPKNEA